MQKERSLIKGKSGFFGDSATKGFSLLEILVAVAVFSVILVLVTGATASTGKNIRHSANNQQAAGLAEEGIEAARNLRDSAADFANLPDGTHGLSMSGNKWNLSGSSDTQGIFTRALTITSTGTHQKKIEVAISWADQYSPANSYLATSYLTNWRAVYILGNGLTINKSVINHGGTKVATDFGPFKANDIEMSLGVATMLPDGPYNVTETSDPNYNQTFSGDCDSTGSITMAGNPTVQCLITNEEKLSYVRVNKTVINHGGTKVAADFAPFKVGTDTVTLGATTVHDSGTYTVSETNDANYSRTFSGDCNSSGAITLVPGQTKSCTLTNEQIANIVGNWAIPSQQSSLDFSGVQDGLKVQVQGNYAYVVRSDGTPDFLIIDISNPASPTVKSGLSLTGIPANIFVAGNYAYVASQDDNQELQIINITNPASPVIAGTFNASGTANGRGIYVVGTTAYLVRDTSTSDEFIEINVSAPATPTLIGSLDLAATGYEVYVAGNYAYVASGSDGQELQVISIVNPASPNIVGSNNISGNNDALTISGYGSLVFLGRAANVYTYNVSSPTAPVLLSTYNGAGTVNDISLNFANSNQYLYFTTGNSNAEFEVVNVSVPATPVSVGKLNLVAYNGIAYDPTTDRAVLVGPNDPELIIVRPQ